MALTPVSPFDLRGTPYATPRVFVAALRVLRRSLIGSSVLLVTAGMAQGPGSPGGFPRPLLNALDTNHDGKISAEEIAAAPHSLLVLDINQDGAITADELQPPPEAAIAGPDDLAHQFMAFDRNGDGVLTRDELPERLQSLFARADTNHDGKLTPAELRALAARQTLPTGSMQNQSNRDPIFIALDTDHDGTISAVEIAASGKTLLTLDKDADGELSAVEMRPPQATPAEQADHFLGENDTDKDGKLSKAETPVRMQAQFDAIDKNHDSFLDRDELIAYFGSNQGGQRGRPIGQDGRPPSPPPNGSGR